MINNHGRFSKRVLTAMIILWFSVAVFGAVINIILLLRAPEVVNLDSFYLYIGAPISGGIVTYLIKSAMENTKKIENSSNEPEAADGDIFEDDELHDGFNDIEVDSDEY